MTERVSCSPQQRQKEMFTSACIGPFVLRCRSGERGIAVGHVVSMFGRSNTGEAVHGSGEAVFCSMPVCIIHTSWHGPCSARNRCARYCLPKFDDVQVVGRAGSPEVAIRAEGVFPNFSVCMGRPRRGLALIAHRRFFCSARVCFPGGPRGRSPNSASFNTSRWGSACGIVAAVRGRGPPAFGLLWVILCEILGQPLGPTLRSHPPTHSKKDTKARHVNLGLWMRKREEGRRRGRKKQQDKRFLPTWRLRWGFHAGVRICEDCRGRPS